MNPISPDVTVHIKEDLTTVRANGVCDALRHLDGVREVYCSEPQRHLLVVAYDPKQVSTDAILARVSAEGLHGKLVAM